MILVDLTIVFLFIIIVFLFTSFLTPFFSKVPFVPVRPKVIKEIISALQLETDSMLYDLGCGDGRVLFAAVKQIPSLRAVGIERAPFPYLCARMRKFFSRLKTVSIIYGDLFKLDTSTATHIFIYLFPELLDALLPKFKKELRPGTRIVSCDFQFSDKKPETIIPMTATKWQINHTLYVYRF